ncbi:hypothetical protein ACH5RR_002979, partial [Cinchona calisaya]
MISYISLLKLEKIPDILGIEDRSTFHDNNPETWHVQISNFKTLRDKEGTKFGLKTGDKSSSKKRSGSDNDVKMTDVEHFTTSKFEGSLPLTVQESLERFSEVCKLLLKDGNIGCLEFKNVHKATALPKEISESKCRGSTSPMTMMPKHFFSK